MKPDNSFKWFFLAIVLGIAAVALNMFSVPDKPLKEASDNAVRSSETVQVK